MSAEDPQGRGAAHTGSLSRRMLIIAAGWIVILLLATGTFQKVLTYVQFTITLCSSLAVLGVFVLRRREPDLPRPVRAWGYPITPLVFLAVNGWMLWHVWFKSPHESLAGLGTLLAGLLLFHFTERRGTGANEAPPV